MRLPLAAVCLCLAAGCSDSGSAQGDAAARRDAAAQRDASAADGSAACSHSGAQVVHFDTDDGVRLEADLYLGGAANAPLAVLLHMVPPTNTRANYPPSFIQALMQRGINVLNIDRRGAGGSGGVAQEAYIGPKGKLDVKAAVDFAAAHACAMDLGRLALVGASNGTTSVLDYTVAAANDATIKAPSALVFLTGGSYTEAQNSLANSVSALGARPLLFVYSSAEKAWSEGFRTSAPGSWSFAEYANGDHGTAMFSAEPTSPAEVADFVAGALK